MSPGLQAVPSGADRPDLVVRDSQQPLHLQEKTLRTENVHTRLSPQHLEKWLPRAVSLLRTCDAVLRGATSRPAVAAVVGHEQVVERAMRGADKHRAGRPGWEVGSSPGSPGPLGSEKP